MLTVDGVGEAASVEVGVVDSTGRVVSRDTKTGTVFWEATSGAAGGVGGRVGTGVGKNVGCTEERRGARDGPVPAKLVLRMLAVFSFLFPIWKN